MWDLRHTYAQNMCAQGWMGSERDFFCHISITREKNSFFHSYRPSLSDEAFFFVVRNLLLDVHVLFFFPVLPVQLSFSDDCLLYCDVPNGRLQAWKKTACAMYLYFCVQDREYLCSVRVRLCGENENFRWVFWFYGIVHPSLLTMSHACACRISVNETAVVVYWSLHRKPADEL